MPASTSTEAPKTIGLWGLSPVVAGTVCCVLSAVGYTLANICMRRLAELKCDPVWAAANKELITVVVVGPWLLWQIARGRSFPVTARSVGLLVLAGLATQLIGNLSVQWAFGVVGLAVTMPAVFGGMLTSSAVLGWLTLGERVSARSMMAISLLLVSIVFLSFGAQTASKSVADNAISNSTIAKQTEPAVNASPAASNSIDANDPPSTVTGWVTALAVLGACLAGGSYSILTITIRHTVTGDTPQTVIVFVITLVGVVCLEPLAAFRLGVEQLTSTPPEQLLWMLAAGTLNLLAFLAITKGLQWTTVVHANVLNASQVAMGAVAGIVFFREARDAWLLFGVCLTIVGIMLIGQPPSDDQTPKEAETLVDDLMADQHA